jgi:hypothetical protein
MNAKAIALALRAAAENLERARQLAQGLPASAVNDVSALALYLDAPKVILALATIAGTLDPAGSAEDEDELLDLAELAALAALPINRRVQVLRMARRSIRLGCPALSAAPAEWA